MNKAGGAEDYRVLRLLEELSRGEPLTQRQLSRRVGIALGLVNSYLRNLIKKGYVTVKNIPPRRFAYYLTPKGFAEKGRLALRLLQHYTEIYHHARTTLKDLFRQLEAEGKRTVVFAGSDEVAEIAYLTLQETDLQLVAVFDDEKAGEEFFSYRIHSLNKLSNFQYDAVVVVSFVKRKNLMERLKILGVPEKVINQVF